MVLSFVFNEPQTMSTEKTNIAFESIKKEFHEKIMPILKDNPGILQKDLYKEGFDSSTFYWLEKLGFIKREKEGASFKLFLCDEKNEPREFLLRSYEEREKIPTEAYLDSKKMIIDYFGKDFLKILFEQSGWHYEQWKTYNKEFGHLYEEKEGWRVIYRKKDEISYLYNQKDDNFYTDQFLFSIGACLKFDINESLKEIIDVYWTQECDEGLKKFYSKYGFFADRAFINLKLGKIIGEHKLMDFYAELEAKARTFKVKWCGAMWDYIQSTHIPWDYAQHLRFQWGLKPELSVKKCLYCGEFFYPFYFASDFYPYLVSLSQIFSYYPIEKSIKEVNFCPKHFPPSSYGTFFEDEMRREPNIIQRMKQLLKELADILEFIPPQTFHANLTYLKDISKEKFEKAILVINEMPPFQKEAPYHPTGYKDIFGSWIAALDAAGILEGGVIKTQRGYMCAANDGHFCRSIGEKIVDDFLHKNKIAHEREPIYAGDRQYRADWKVGRYFIEFWGLKGDEDYDKKIEEKREIAQKHDIPLIELTFEDLRKLDEKLKDLIS